MSTLLNQFKSPFTLASLMIIGVLVSFLFVTNHTARAEGGEPEPTYTVSLMLKFSEHHPDYTASMFSFTVTGTSASGTPVSRNISLTHYDDTTATADITLPIGSYSIDEVGPAGFTPGQWTVQWSGSGCQNINGPSLSTTLTVTNDQTRNVCRADNQWRPGKLTVEKKFVAAPTSPNPSDFSFVVKQGAEEVYSGQFQAGGIEVKLSVGNYEVIEKDYPNYTTNYSNGCSGTVEQGGSITCTITNTWVGNGTSTPPDAEKGTLVVKKVVIGGNLGADAFSFLINGTATTTFNSTGINTLNNFATGTYSITEVPNSSYQTVYNNCNNINVSAGTTTTCTITNTYISNGGGNTGDDDYRLQGYVWHDNNKDGVWDQGEEPLPGWTVYASSSDTLLSTTTDQNGFYYFHVSEGTWILTEVLQTDWEITHPTPKKYEVIVPEEMELASNLRFPFNLFISIAHAETIIINNDFNFGNVFGGGVGGGGDSSGGGGRGGGGGYTKRSTSPDPTPEVLGESITIVPVGAPATGAGGSATKDLPAVIYLVFALILLREFSNAKKVTIKIR